MADYKLVCSHPECGKVYDSDNDFRLRCDSEIDGKHGPAFLQAVYQKSRIEFRSELPGIFQYCDWLPTGDCYMEPRKFELGRPYCYRSSGLSKWLGLNHLYIAFSGYWPEKGPNLVTRTFKEFEAQGTLARYLSIYHGAEPMPFIVSSAGNTANGFNLVTHLLDLPVYLVVPEAGLHKLELPFETKPCVIVVKGDYTDAIEIADQIADRTGLMREGGARNVARRAGMGAAMLNAVAHPQQGSGELFDHYFQAVGSGTGAIAAWEAVQLLLADGRFGSTVTRIHMVQNSPFTPIVDSWLRKREKLVEIDEAEARAQIACVTAQVLTNRHPPYSIAAGLYDVLKKSNGATWSVNNYRLFHAARKFREAEIVDIGPAAAVAVDGLRQAVEAGEVKSDDTVLLHITGGGRECQFEEGKMYGVRTAAAVQPGELDKALAAIGEPSCISGDLSCLKRYRGD